ncbi:hypothetical protein [Arcobacter roscoffensis]|uniref:Uncharacterized protein n=1 Tax=Arcobacter roscoffensis TaxID=2961520 RepID=A0ABY5E3S9_9BACT|nr:hypothetical protein [Arcobacter roscoffensis]UTJ06207.1 hypothetical protein NJU99_13275 [Arcobacter roscoffensis]
MFKFDRVENMVLNHKYIIYLKDIGIDTDEVINNIKINIEEKGYILDDVFSNPIYKMLSTNILVENIIFEEVNKFLFDNYKDSVVFEEDVSIDIKSILASQNSVIDRPNIKKPSEIQEGFIKEFNVEENFVRIARFEREIIKDSHDIGRKGQSILFEGIIPHAIDINRLFCNQTSNNIWNNDFCRNEMNLVGLCTLMNSIETTHILWFNSYFIKEFLLKLDNFNKGLRAINENNEVVLEFRQWRKDLIGNGASFVGHDSNIATLEGCDLLLREDYFQELNKIFPELIIRAEKIES